MSNIHNRTPHCPGRKPGRQTTLEQRRGRTAFTGGPAVEKPGAAAAPSCFSPAGMTGIHIFKIITHTYTSYRHCIYKKEQQHQALAPNASAGNARFFVVKSNYYACYEHFVNNVFSGAGKRKGNKNKHMPMKPAGCPGTPPACSQDAVIRQASVACAQHPAACSQDSTAMSELLSIISRT